MKGSLYEKGKKNKWYEGWRWEERVENLIKRQVNLQVTLDNYQVMSCTSPSNCAAVHVLTATLKTKTSTNKHLKVIYNREPKGCGFSPMQEMSKAKGKCL